MRCPGGRWAIAPFVDRDRFGNFDRLQTWMYRMDLKVGGIGCERSRVGVGRSDRVEASVIYEARMTDAMNQFQGLGVVSAGKTPSVGD